MVEPVTQNVGLIVPNTGDLPGTWGSGALNPDFVALDGMLGGVATVGLTNVNVTLSKPAGTIAPGAGPNQAQNAVLRFTGVLTGNVTVTLPLPGVITIENLTTGNFVVSFRAVGVGEVIATPQGSCMRVYNDGTNVRFVNDLSCFPGKSERLDGVSAVPAWINACTVKPYLLADGAVYPVATYPALAALFGNKFGGDGVTTFGVPDKQGRVDIPYAGATGRITVAGCGINGQLIGAAGGEQAHTLTPGESAALTYTSAVNDPGHLHQMAANFLSATSSTLKFAIETGGVFYPGQPAFTNISVATSSNAGGGAHNNVQPAIVSGICLIKT